MQTSQATWETCLEHASISDIGLRRLNNQDSFACVLAGNEESWRQRGHLFMVADGMGAHAAGELASKMAADTVPHSYFKLRQEAPAAAIEHAIEDANRKIHSHGQANLDFRGMGTTASVLLLHSNAALVAHVGDSRVYRLRGNRLEQLTFDHSLVWEMMASGRLKENEVPSYIPKNIITRSLGPNEHVHIDLEGPFPLAPGDTFLLCSDGLSGVVEDEELGVIMRTLPPAEVVQVLVDLANLRGGPDNITVIVAKVQCLPPADEALPLYDPVTISGPPRRRVHPVAWALFALMACTSLILYFVLKKPAPGILAGVGAAIAAVVIGAQRLGVGSAPAYRVEGARLGLGPHRSLVCESNPQFLEKLAVVSQQLRDAATEKEWSVNWEKFNAFIESAQRSAESKDYANAAREYCHAISFMMQEVRRQRTRGES